MTDQPHPENPFAEMNEAISAAAEMSKDLNGQLNVIPMPEVLAKYSEVEDADS